MKKQFLDKLIGRLEKLPSAELQAYIVRMAQERGFMETIFNVLQEGVIVTDTEGRITFFNQAACSLFGIDPQSCIGRKLSDRVRGLDWDAIAGSEKIITRDMELFFPENRFLNFYVVPLRLEEPLRSGDEPRIDDVFGYAMIVRDITETRRSTQEIIESERMSALTLLAAGVAHEIGNPLNSLHIHLQLVERQLRKIPEDLRGGVEDSIYVAKEEIQRLEFIVTQFLRAIRPSTPRTVPENINSIVQESVRFLEGEIQNRGISIETELRQDIPQLELDRDQMKQAFYNIIKNGFQAMKAEGILRIRTDMDHTHVVASFSDTGGGISPENMSKLFHPYFTTKKAGSGLGLLIVRRIVREHGGEIEIESDEGVGTTVTIRMPFVDRRVRLLQAGGSSPDESHESGQA